MKNEIFRALASVRARIDAATVRRGPGSPPRLIGVSKRQDVAKLVAAYEAGLVDFGENYAQEFRDKFVGLQDSHPQIRWHFIGALQKNKLKYVVGRALIHTVDSIDLARAIEQRAMRDGVVQECLIQVNPGESQKAGVSEDQVAALLDELAGCTRLRCVGLMMIPPAGDPEQTRPYFRMLRELAEHEQKRGREHIDLRELSMGMSGDFETAIEEGATMVRVGTSIFGSRPNIAGSP